MFLTPLALTLPLGNWKQKIPFKNSALVFLSCVFLLACSRPQAMNKVVFNNQVKVSISTQKQYRLGQAIKVSFVIKNGTNKPIQLLKWGTPLEGQLTRNSFRVTYKNKELPYQGRLFKRAKPTKKDFIILPALTSIQADITVTSEYPISHAGQYTIAYRTSYLSVENSSKQIKNSLVKLQASNLVNFIVTEPHN